MYTSTSPQAVDDDVSLAAIHDNAEKFTPQVEQVFKSLQIISACAMAFAHGANDVANAVGPFAAIYSIYQDGYISRRSAIEPWMLAGIGASGEASAQGSLW
jgi:sodium-dependent phosphate transporter